MTLLRTWRLWCSFAVLLAGLALPLGAASAAGPLRVAVISDLNGSYGSTDYAGEVSRAVARIIELRPDLVISTGDMVAGQRRPHLSQRAVEAMWSAFHAQVSEPLEAVGIPLAVTPGNHDGSAYRGFELERDIFAAQWEARRPGVRFVDDGAYPFYYAFALGEVLFVSVDATVVGRLPQRQMDWLRGLLEAEGPRYRYRVVFSHVPLWPFAEGRLQEIIGDSELQAVLEAADVDIYLSGHHHAFYPGSLGDVAFVGQACLGAGPRRLAAHGRRSDKAFALLEFKDEGIKIGAFKGPEFVDTVAWQGLPERVRSSVAELVRADLAGVAIEMKTAR